MDLEWYHGFWTDHLLWFLPNNPVTTAPSFSLHGMCSLTCHSLTFPFSLSFCSFFWDRVSVCSLGCPGTYSVNHTGFGRRDLLVSAFWALVLKVFTTTACLPVLFKVFFRKLHFNTLCKSWDYSQNECIVSPYRFVLDETNGVLCLNHMASSSSKTHLA